MKNSSVLATDNKYYHYALKIHDSLREGTPEANPLYISTKKGVMIDGVECADWMNMPGSISSSINPKESKCSVSSVKIKTINKNYTISQWLMSRTNADNTMTYGEKAELWAILSDGSLVLIYTGIIRDISSDPLGSYYEFGIADFQDRIKTAIFEREFSEYSTETVADINTYRLPGDATKGFYMTEVDEGDTDEDGNPIDTRVITFRGHVIDFVEYIFEIAFSTDTLAIGAHYLSDDWRDFVDTSTLDKVRATLSGSMYEFYFEFRESIDDPYGFLNENIYQPCAIFPYVNSEGKLGIKLHEQPLTGTTGITISEANIITVDSVNTTDENIVNHIKTTFGWNFKDNEGTTSILSADSTSFDKFKILIPRDEAEEYEIKGINKLSKTDRATFAKTLTDSMFARYALPTQEVSVTVPLEVGTQWRVGNYLFLTHNTIIGWEGDSAGLPGIGSTSEPDPVDPYDGNSYMDVGHEWAGFIEGNSLGVALDGTTVIDTSLVEISVDLFNNDTVLSCKKNQNEAISWLSSQGW